MNHTTLIRQHLTKNRCTEFFLYFTLKNNIVWLTSLQWLKKFYLLNRIRKVFFKLVLCKSADFRFTTTVKNHCLFGRPSFMEPWDRDSWNILVDIHGTSRSRFIILYFGKELNYIKLTHSFLGEVSIGHHEAGQCTTRVAPIIMLIEESVKLCLFTTISFFMDNLPSLSSHMLSTEYVRFSL